MPQQTKIFRVFVSSTFADMRRERQLLHEKVFPVLEEFCKTHGARFQAIDLRWGVSEESQRNQKTMEICLNEIRRCQRMSPRPNFLVLLGDRYGWQPAPTAIPESEMAQLRPLLAHDAWARVEDWYRLDKNAVPAEYVLQPWGECMETYSAWESIENELRDSLREAALAANLPESAIVKYMASATHQEILAGALDIPREAPDPESHVLALARRIPDLPQTDQTGDLLEHAKGKPDSYSRDPLQQLRDALKAKLKDNYVEYRADRGPEDIALTEELEFIERIIKHLKSVIEDELRRLTDEDEIQQEAQYHRAFAETLTEHFTGREDVLKGIWHYLDDTQPHRVFSFIRKRLLGLAKRIGVDTQTRRVYSLIGTSGSGKSSVMAQALTQARKRNAVVLCRFIGANANSSNLASLLGRLCVQIAREYGTTLEDLAEEGQKGRLFDPAVLSNLFQKCLVLATNERPLILFLDALDHLSGADNARSLYWLPKTLSEHTYVVVSSIPELKGALSFTQTHSLPPMRALEGKRLLDTWLHVHSRKLTKPQTREVLNRFNACGLPLFLKIAFEQARKWHSYERAPRLPGDVSALVTRFFTGLEREHSGLLVSKAVSYILAGRDNGLTEDEVLDLMVFDEDYWNSFLDHSHPTHRAEAEAAMKLPVVIWSRLYLDLLPYMTERDSYGERIVGFYHRQFNEILAEHYIPDATPIHATLGAYFKTLPCYLDEHTRKKPNVRKCTEQPWQQIRGAMWNEVSETLCDLPFLEAKNEAGMTFDLVRDFQNVLAVMSTSRDYYQTLSFLAEALERDIHFVARHVRDYPQALFQCLWNSCWWYDCPDAEKYYEAPKDERNALSPRKQPGLKLHELLETWRVHKDTISPRFHWIRSLRPPAMRLGTAQRNVFHGHLGPVTSVAYSPDGSRIASGSSDTTVLVWDVVTGQELACLRGHTDTVTTVAYSPNGTRITSGSYDGTVRIWDIATGHEEACLRGHDKYIESVTFSPDGTQIASGSFDRTVRVWDVETARQVLCLRGHESGISSLAYSPDGDRIATGSWDKTARVWVLIAVKSRKTVGKEVLCLQGHGDCLTDIAYSPNGTRITTASYDRTVRVWDAATGEPLACLEGHGGNVTSVAYSRDATQIASGSDDATLRLWDANTGRVLACLYGHESGAVSLAYSPDGIHLVSGSSDSTVRVWDINVAEKGIPKGRESVSPHGHESSGITVAYSPDGTQIASGSSDTTVRIWDASTGLELLCLRGYNVSHLIYSPNGAQIVAWGGWGEEYIRVLNAISGEEVARLCTYGNTVFGVTYSPDGTRIAVGSGDDTVRIWHPVTGQELACLRGHKSCVFCVVYSPDGSRIASGSWDGTVRVWNASTGQELASLRGHKNFVWSVAYSADGTRVAAGGDCEDKTVRVWNASTGCEQLCLRGHDSYITGLAFSPDGTKIVSASSDTTMRVWDTSTGECLKVIDGEGSVVAVALGAKVHPLRALARGLEVIIEDASSARALAWCPGAFNSFVNAPGGRTWAGATHSSSYVYLVRLEGI